MLHPIYFLPTLYTDTDRSIHTVTCPYTLCILIHEARTLVFMIIITDQFSFLQKIENNI